MCDTGKGSCRYIYYIQASFSIGKIIDKNIDRIDMYLIISLPKIYLPIIYIFNYNEHKNIPIAVIVSYIDNCHIDSSIDNLRSHKIISLW